MSMLQQSGSSGVERQARLDEWRRIWTPAAPAAMRTPAVDKTPAVDEPTRSAIPNERSAWTTVQLPFLAAPGSADDADASINRVSAMKAYEETNG